MHHCNLNCAGCAHFAPLADGKWFLSPLTLRMGLMTLREVGHAQVGLLRLFGGEPLLHPNLLELVDVAQNECTAKVQILSNGAAWRTALLPIATQLCDRNVEVEFTHYPGVSDYKLAVGLLRGVGLNVEFKRREKQMRHHALSTTPRVVREGEHCLMRDYGGSVQMVVEDGKTWLWSCPVPAYSHIARAVFDDIPTPGEDCRVLVDHELVDIDLEAFGRPTSFCAHCTVGAENMRWRTSSKSRDEW